MEFEIIGPIEEVHAIAVGSKIRRIMMLRRRFGPGRWRKLKGTAHVRLLTGEICRAEIHWYEASGVGRFGWKIKRLLDEESR